MSIGYLVQARFPYLDDISRDEAVNSLLIYAQDTTTEEAVMDIGQAAWSKIYNSAVAGQLHPIGYYLSEVIDRAHCELTFYRFADAEPRTPMGTRPFAVGARTGGQPSLPLQVALCITTYGTGETVEGSAELNVRRRRGRLYIGPLNTATLSSADDSAGVCRPSDQFMTDLARAFGDVMLTGVPGAGGTGFAVRSRSAGLPVGTKPPAGTRGEGTIVTHGLVNNEWDIQRRRGVDNTAHTNLSVAP